MITKDKQYIKFSAYGFLKNLRFFDAFFILFLLEKGLIFTEIGILYAIREIVIQIFEIPSGIIADTYGRKNSLVASFVLYIASFLTFYQYTNFWAFLAAFVLYGIADAFRSGTHKGMIMDYLKINNWSDQKIEYYGNTRSWSQKGSALSSLIAGLVVFYSGSYQFIFIYSIIPYLLNFFLILSYPKELNHALKKKTQKEQSPLKKTFGTFWHTIKEPAVLKIANTSALHTAYLKSIKDYIQPLLASLAVALPILTEIESGKKTGIIIGTAYFIIYMLTSNASQYAFKLAQIKTINIAKTTLFSGLLFGIISGAAITFKLWWIALIAFVAIYLIENMRKPILTGYIADEVPNDILSSVISAQSQIKTVLSAVLSIIFGVLADKFGIGFSLIAVSGLLISASIVINIITQKNLPK